MWVFNDSAHLLNRRALPSVSCSFRTFKLLWMIGEVGEVVDIVKKNGGRRAIEEAGLREHLVEEMADVLMYYNDILLC